MNKLPADWAAHASRVLVSASHRNALCFPSHPQPAIAIQGKVRDRADALARTREACATRMPIEAQARQTITMMNQGA